ncbi:MAG: LPS export ABC transporter permease LptF [Gammaproteobacteria bacterium]|nr:LPS export ABC transporter permease LptF [Gammaproteobacteria bacterium]
MSLITRYINKEVLVSAFAVSMVLLLIISSSRFAHYLSKAVTGELEAQAVLIIIVNLLPAYLSTLLPLGGFLGVLLTLGRLSVDNELTVLFANGVSQRQLVKVVLVPLSLLALLVAILSLWLAPETSRNVEEILYEQSHTAEFDNVVAGRFQGNIERQIIYAETMSEDRQQLLNVFVFNRPDPASAPVLIKATSARQVFDEEYQTRYLLLKEGSRTEGQPGQLDYTVTRFEDLAVRLYTQELQINITRGFTLPTLILLGSDQADHRAQLYWRISLPLMTLIVSFVAIALGQVNPRKGRFARLLPAILVYLVYLSALTSLRDDMARAVDNADLKIWLLHTTFLLLGLLLVFGRELTMRRAGGGTPNALT